MRAQSAEKQSRSTRYIYPIFELIDGNVICILVLIIIYFVALILNLMSKIQSMEQQIHTESQTNDFIKDSQSSAETLSSMRALTQSVLLRLTIVRASVSAHKPHFYLASTVLCIIYSFLSYSYYREALICMYQNQKDCLEYGLNPQAKKIKIYAALLLADCFIFIFYCYSFLLKKTYRILTAVGISQHIVLFYTGQFQMSVFNMMGIIKIIHYPLLLISAALLLLAVSLKACLRKNAKLTFASLAAFCLIFYLVVLRNQCYFWRQGINGQIEDREDSCKIDLPMCAYLQTISRFDLNYFIHNCFLGDQYRQIFDQHFSYDLQNGTIVGFSDLKDTSEVQRSHGHIATTVFQLAKRYKTIEDAQKTQKHDVIFDTAEQRYHINVIYNRTLAEEKAEAFRNFESSSSAPLVKNVLVIFLDSVSRFETHIKLPKFVSWFEKQAKQRSYSPDEPAQPLLSQAKSEAYEFYKYHAMGYYSSHNIFPMFYGRSTDEMHNSFDSSQQATRSHSFHKEFSDRGFVTSFSSSFCASYGADIYDGDIPAVVNPTADHQAFSFNCDPNFHEPYFQFGFTKGNSAATDRCLYHSTEAEYAFQYTANFFDKYRDSAKLSQINLIEGHEYFGGSVRFIDDAVTDFLEDLQAKGHLKDTLVVALSDHGQHQGNAFESIMSDHYNPFLYLAAPEQLNRQFRNSIRLNQQNLITAYNFYHLLMHLAVGQAYAGKALGLLSDLSFQTNCSAINIRTSQQQACVCH